MLCGLLATLLLLSSPAHAREAPGGEPTRCRRGVKNPYLGGPGGRRRRHGTAVRLTVTLRGCSPRFHPACLPASLHTPARCLLSSECLPPHARLGHPKVAPCESPYPCERLRPTWAALHLRDVRPLPFSCPPNLPPVHCNLSARVQAAP